MKRPRLPKAPEEANRDNLHQWMERLRYEAHFRDGKADTVRRLRTDAGFRKAVVEHAINIAATARAPLFRDAMNACIRNRELFERNLREGKGIWADEFEPLAPKERTHLLAKLKKMWDIPEQLERPELH